MIDIPNPVGGKGFSMFLPCVRSSMFPCVMASSCKWFAAKDMSSLPSHSLLRGVFRIGATRGLPSGILSNMAESVGQSLPGGERASCCLDDILLHVALSDSLSDLFCSVKI